MFTGYLLVLCIDQRLRLALGPELFVLTSQLFFNTGGVEISKGFREYKDASAKRV